ncbi:putative metal-nicotianamine transporter YSL8 [Raphanus sativus]|nr:putative metal-nicotianamine transporter YSL8 [Raphanus sativus]
MILGDGAYNFCKVLSRTPSGLLKQIRGKASEEPPASPLTPKISYDDQRRTRFFLKDKIPSWFAGKGYVVIAAVSTAILPLISLDASTYGKHSIFTIGAWAGSDHGGLLAGLAACGVMMNIVSTASDLTQDFKTGYLTLLSPRAMFVSQMIGKAMGCLVSPCTVCNCVQKHGQNWC